MTIYVVSGFRGWKNQIKIFNVLSSCHITLDDELRVGDASGVDLFVRQWSVDNNLTGITKVYQAQWDLYGKAAGPIRNEMMLLGQQYGPSEPFSRPKIADLLIAFPEPYVMAKPGSGTWNTIHTAWRWGIEVKLPRYYTTPIKNYVSQVIEKMEGK